MPFEMNFDNLDIKIATQSQKAQKKAYIRTTDEGQLFKKPQNQKFL